MRRRPKFYVKKSTSAIKSRVSVLHGDKASTATKKRAPVPWSRRAKCQTRIRIHSIRLEKRNKRSLGQTSVARRMAQLHLPFVDPSKRQLRSDAETLKQLRWSNVDVPLDHQKVWEAAHHLRQEALTRFNGENGLHWNAPPRKSPYRAIVTYIQHLFWGWKRGPTLQIPQGWPAFSSVDWEHEPLFELATSDSSESRVQVRNDQSSAQLGDSIDYKRQERHRTIIHCQPGLLQQPRIRMQWELLEGMMPSSFKWRPQTTARAERRDVRRHAGFLDYNQRSLNKDLWPQAALSALIYPSETQKEWYRRTGRPASLSERHEKSEVGRMVMNAVSTDAFPFQWRQTLSWPSFLARGVPPPLIDYTCQAECIGSTRGKSARPLLFAAQSRGTGTDSSIKQLALAFQPMMALFILYYLDTRASPEEPMPHWMVLFGAIYDEDGIEIFAFYPSFRLPDSKLHEEVGGWGWGTTSCCVSHDYTEITSEPPWERGPPLSMLYRIQGHCLHVLEQLKCWDGYQRVSARLDDGDSSTPV